MDRPLVIKQRNIHVPESGFVHEGSKAVNCPENPDFNFVHIIDLSWCRDEEFFKSPF